MLDRLCEQPTKHANRVNGKGERARKWPEPNSGHEQQCPDEVRDGAGKPDHAACSVIKPARRSDVGGRENRQRQRQDDAAHGAEDAKIDRFEGRPPNHVDLAEIGRHRAPDDVGHAVGAGDQILRPGVHDDRRLRDNRQKRQHEHETQCQANCFGPAALCELPGSRR